MPQNIVVVGAGFAGMWSALGARRLIHLHGGDVSDIQVTVVAPEPTLVIRPRLYEENPGSMSAPLGELFRVTGVKFVQGMVDTIRTEQRELEVVDSAEARSTLTYDRLVLAAGSRLTQPNVPGLREHTFNVDQIEGAECLDTHLKSLVSLPATKARNTVVVAGGGFTGIEIAAELPARLRSILGHDVGVRVVIVERAPKIGHELGPGPRPFIIEALTALGVESKLGSAVASVDSDGVTTAAGERIEALTVIWATGMEANVLTQQITDEKDRQGRLHVDENLRVPSCKDVFAAGDVAFAATDDQGHNAMMSCQHAMPLGRSAGHNAAADLLGVKLLPYSQTKYATCLDLGPWGSVVSEGWDRQVKVAGAVAKPIKQYVNGVLIYPPKPDAAEAFAAADPTMLIPSLTSGLASM